MKGWAQKLRYQRIRISQTNQHKGKLQDCQKIQLRAYILGESTLADLNRFTLKLRSGSREKLGSGALATRMMTFQVAYVKPSGRISWERRMAEGTRANSEVVLRQVQFRKTIKVEDPNNLPTTRIRPLHFHFL